MMQGSGCTYISGILMTFVERLCVVQASDRPVKMGRKHDNLLA
jgi:hypothetical protein